MKLKIFAFLTAMALVSCNNSHQAEAGKNKKDSMAAEQATMSATPEYAGEEVEYTAGGVTMKGYLAYDKNATEKRPGVLVVHEWWGHNEHTRNSADKLAEAGYIALAVDMYGDGKVATHPEDAKKFSGQVMQDFEMGKKRFNAARQLLESHEKTEAGEIAAIGYCFGGGVVLNMARQGADLDAVVSLHGSLNAVKPAEKDVVKAHILVLNGADDPFVPKEQVEAFKKEMDAANADYEFISYPNAKHAFTNPKATEIGKEHNLPLEYNAEVAEKSWEATLSFLDKTFKQGS